MKVLIPASLDEKQFNWTDEPVTGIILMNAERDSVGDKIDPNAFYFVGKHKETGQLAIIYVPGLSPQNICNQ
jgi:hypothetical protein